jgi:hypothetical protein
MNIIYRLFSQRQKNKHEKGHHDSTCSYCGMGDGDDYGMGLGGDKGERSKNDPEVSIKLSRLEKMEQRLITLEKIITDKGYNLADEIENL